MSGNLVKLAKTASKVETDLTLLYSDVEMLSDLPLINEDKQALHRMLVALDVAVSEVAKVNCKYEHLIPRE